MPSPSDDSITRWSRIAGGDYDYLVRKFWKPLRRFFASRLPPSEDADDALQDLFLSFVKKDLMDRAPSIQGRFRAYLFGCARNFLIDRERDRTAKKRGGDRVIPLGEREGAFAAPPPGPDVFERDWFRSVLDQARENLEEEYDGRGRAQAYRAFSLFFFGEPPGERWPQKKIAESLGLPVTQVSNHVLRGKARFGDAVREVIERYAASPEDVQAELAELARIHAAGGAEAARGLDDLEGQSV